MKKEYTENFIISLFAVCVPYSLIWIVSKFSGGNLWVLWACYGFAVAFVYTLKK